MPGANYMGGKRNTARARVKDAAGKVQRDHFGKKRFEILRSGLSRGQAGTGHPGLARNGAKPVPEISLAHARRAVGGGQLQDNSRDTMLRTFTSPLATTHRRSSPSSASSRSRILSTLDAANPEAQRSQVKKILQIPDLLGLSTTQKRNHPRRVARSSESSRDWQTPPHSRADGHTRDSTPSTFSLKTPPPQYQGNLEWTEHSLHAHSYDGQCISPSAPCKPNATFIPLRFDSSPARLVDDYGYADSWPGTPELRPYEDSLSTSYEPARVPFYPAVASPAKPPTPGEGRALLAKRLAKRRSDSLESLFSFSGTPRCGRLDLDFGPSPSSTQLPLNLTQAKFVSNLSSMEGICADARMSLDALPYSESLHSSWSGATDRLPESDDIPQASFSQSPSTNCSPDNFRASSSSTDLVCGAGYASACSSPLTGGSRHLRSFGDAPANDDPHFLQQVYLVDLLGGALFGEADPWCALDDVLDLPATSLNISGNSEDAFPELANAHDRCGVGYLCQPHSDPPCRMDDNSGPAEGYVVGACELRDDLQLGFCDVLTISGREEPAQSLDYRHHSPLAVSPFSSLKDMVPISGELPDPAASASVGEEAPLPVQASLAASDLDSLPDAPFRKRERENEETQEMMSCAQASQSSEYTGEDAAKGDNVRHDGHHVAISAASGSCRASDEDDGGLVDGPSLFSDDELVESEDE